MRNGRSVLLLGNFRPAVAITRRLAAMGYRVIVTRDKGGLAAASRHCAEVWDAPRAAEDPLFFDALAAFLEQRPDIDIVMPVAEAYVLGLAHNRAKLPEDRTYATPRDDLVITCLDKIAMLDVCERAGVPSAPARTVTTFEDLHDAAREIGYPLIVRPLWSTQPIAGRKAFICMEPETFAQHMTAWPEGHDSLIVQRFIRGPRFNVDYAAQNGRTIHAVATRILRTDAADYTGIDVSGVTVPMPDDLWAYTEAMNRELNYTGVGLIQFMVDPDRGETSFLELNPRFNGNTAVPDRAGLELIRLAIDLAEDPDREEPQVISDGGLRHAWLYGDVQGVRKSIRHGMMEKRKAPAAFGRALRDGMTADFHLVWNWRDPMPAISQVTNTIRNALRGQPD